MLYIASQFQNIVAKELWCTVLYLMLELRVTYFLRANLKITGENKNSLDGWSLVDMLALKEETIGKKDIQDLCNISVCRASWFIWMSNLQGCLLLQAAFMMLYWEDGVGPKTALWSSSSKVISARQNKNSGFDSLLLAQSECQGEVVSDGDEGSIGAPLKNVVGADIETDYPGQRRLKGEKRKVKLGTDSTFCPKALCSTLSSQKTGIIKLRIKSSPLLSLTAFYRFSKSEVLNLHWEISTQL